jgi:hypothetical protein
MADKNKKIIYTLELNDKGKVKIDGLTKGFVNASTAVKNLNKDLIQQGQIMQENNRVNQDMIDKTGLAGATLVELGRTISDSNYGIRGMANNLSQLSTLMITLISTTGGVFNGVKALLSAFMGPLGLIIAFQAVIALIEKQDMEAQKLKRTTDSLGAGVADTAGNFEIYIRKLQDSNESQEQQALAIQKLNKEFPDFVKSLKESGTSMDDIKNNTIGAIEAINEYRRSIVALAYSEAARKKIRDLAAKEMDVEKAAIDELREGGMSLDKARTLWAKREEIRQNNQLSDAEKRIAINKIFRKEIVEGSEEFSKFNLDRAADIIDSLDAENISIQEQINLLVKRVILEEDRLKKGLSRDKKFKASQLDFEKEIIKSQGRISASLIRNNELKVKEEFDTIRELAVLKQKDFAEAQQRRVDNIKDEKLKAIAQEKVNKEIAASEESLVKYIIQLRAERDRTINQMRIDDLSNASDLMEKEQGIRKQSALEFNSFLALTNKERFDADIELEKLKTENIILEIEKQIAAVQIAGEDTRGLEEKLDRVREQLFQRQVERGAKLIRDESKRINGIIKATQGAFSQLSNVFTSYTDARIAQLERERNYILNSESLTKAAQQERIKDIEKREIEAQKNKIRLERELFTIKQSLLISEQVMKAKAVILENKLKIQAKIGEITNEGAIQAGKAKMSIGAFVSEGGLKGLATYAITIGGLLASIFAARKKAESQLRSLGGPSVGAVGGGGGGVEAPDFNVVGASPESQLAQSVLGQQQKPLRAFVVHKDIKTADELDRNTAKSLG